MIDLQKYQVDIESDNKGMTIELYATSEEQAVEKVNWLLNKEHLKCRKSLKKIDEES